MQDYKYYNDVAKEEKVVREDVKKCKTRILKIQDVNRRQAEWNKLFPKFTSDTLTVY